MKTDIRIGLENGDRLTACAQPQSKAVSLSGPLLLDGSTPTQKIMLMIPLSQVPKMVEDLTTIAAMTQRVIDAEKEPAHEA